MAPITNDPPLPTGGTAPAKQRRGRDNCYFRYYIIKDELQYFVFFLHRKITILFVQYVLSYFKLCSKLCKITINICKLTN